jgi:hypothetical protein
MMAKDRPHQWFDIETQFKGKIVKGRYYQGVVTVTTMHGRETTQPGSLPADVIADDILRNLAERGQA